jgi:predicted nucleic acid-binding protein
MTRVFDASKGCSFSGRRILFDTNIWIAIDGNDPRPHHANYSNFFGDVLQSDNQLITNDYIISEYFNRSCKIQYQLQYKHEANPWSQFKARRKAGDLAGFLQDIRDLCHDILKDCIFENAITPSCNMVQHVAESAAGMLDMSDIVIREHCSRNGYVLVTDDADFLDCGLEVVTANPKVLRLAKANRTLAN